MLTLPHWRGKHSLMRLADVDTWSGKNDKALGDLREALPVLQKLLAEQPQDALAQINVGRCLSRTGVVHRETGDYPAALEALHHAEAIMEPLIRREPDNRPALMQYCYELTMEDEAYNDQKTPEATTAALALSPRLVRATETLAAKDAQDTTVQHNLATAYYDYGTWKAFWHDEYQRLRTNSESPEQAQKLTESAHRVLQRAGLPTYDP